MPEIVNGGSSNQPPKEMSMELRLLVAFLLMGAVMFLTPYLFKSQAPVTPAGHNPGQKAQTAQPGAAPLPDGRGSVAETAKAPSEAVAAPSSAAPVAPATAQQTLPPYVIQTNLFRVAISNQGATVRSWQLQKFKGNDNKPLELVNTASGLPYPFSLSFPEQKPTTDVNWAWYQQTPDADGLGVKYEFSDGHTVVRKSFRFQKDSYLATVATDVTVDGKAVRAKVQWLGGFGDLTVSNPSSNQQALYFDVPQNKLVQQTARSVKNGPVTVSGEFSFAGVADRYFAAVFLPQGNTAMELTTTADTVRTPVEEKPAAFPG